MSYLSTLKQWIVVSIFFILLFFTAVYTVGAKPRPKKVKYHTFIVTPYHVFIQDDINSKPKEIF